LGGLRPSAVDLNSRLESSPGIKDHELMARAILAVKKYEKENLRGEL